MILLIYLTIALIAGILAGTITGLIPGIHVNLILILALGVSASILTNNPLILAIFIISMAITHTFIDYIPSIFLGAPDEDSFLSVLPGHKLLLQGRAYYAIIYTLYGSLIALPIILLFIPIFIYLLPIVYPYVLRIMWIILILISGYLIFSEQKTLRLWALIIFILAGFLGIASLNLNIKEPLLPLLTGLFGASNILISIRQNTKIPIQKITPIRKIRLRKKSIAKASFASIIAAPFTAFLPGLGASQAALIGKQVANIQDQREFLFLLGAINTIVMGLSFIALYSINITRTGSAVAISKLIPSLSFSNLIYIILTIIFSGILASIITIQIAKLTAKNINKFSYKKISIIILAVLTIITIYFTQFLGLLIFITSTALGITTIQLGIKRMHLMGCLLIPTILYYIL